MKSILVSKQDFLRTYTSDYYSNKYALEYDKISPIKINYSLVYIVGSLMTDGFMDIRKRGNRPYYGYIGYFSKYKKELNNFNNNFNNVFQTTGKIQNWGIRKSGKSFGCIILNSTSSRILNILDVPSGDKVIQEYSIPSWITNSNKNYQAAFLRRIFSCEGSIVFDISSNCWEIRYSMSKTETLSKNAIKFLNDIRMMLSNFNIKTSNPYINERYTRPKDQRNIFCYAIKIKRKKSVYNFYKHIGFDIHYKQKKLKKFRSSYIS
jgi:intein/homing endonuclease